MHPGKVVERNGTRDQQTMVRIRSGPIEGDEEYSAEQCFEETWNGGFETQNPNGLLVSRNLNPMPCTYILLVGRSPGEMLI